MTATEFKEWLRTARPGDVAVYHVGYLPRDCRDDIRRSAPPGDALELRAVRSAAYAAARAGVVDVTQHRAGEFAYSYMAARRRHIRPLPERVEFR